MFKENWKKLTIFALIALFAVTVGVLVYPTPKEARAANHTVNLTVQWGWMIQEYNVSATAQLLDCQHEPIGNPINLGILESNCGLGLS